MKGLIPAVKVRTGVLKVSIEVVKAGFLGGFEGRKGHPLPSLTHTLKIDYPQTAQEKFQLLGMTTKVEEIDALLKDLPPG